MSSAGTPSSQSNASSWPAGGGKMGQRIREFDWSQHPLGPTDNWPQSLRTTVSLMLGSRYAMWMGWGPEFWFFCNDAYLPTVGIRESWVLGESARKVWAEIWPDVGPLAESVVTTGNATWDEGLLLFLERSGFREETYHTFSYSPIPDDEGGIGGMLCVVAEETERVIGERRLALLGDMATRLTSVKAEAELYVALQRCLEKFPKDISFTLVYLFDDEGQTARLASRGGVSDGAAIAPTVIDLEAEETVWPAKAIQQDKQVLMRGVGAWANELPCGPWDIPPKTAAVVPLFQSGMDEPVGFLVVGTNPYRPFDQASRGFVDLMAGQVAAALSNVRSYEQERQRAEALAEINRVKTAFFSNVSHEFRTPLTLMLGPLEDILNKSSAGVRQENRSLAEVAHRNGLRLLRLVNTLLDFSRIEAGRMQAVFEPLDLAAVTADIASTFRSAMERAGLVFEVECAPLKEPVYADHDLWEKIILNLLSNAFKFTLEGRVTVRMREAGEFVELAVQDSGAGISEEGQKRLFERFYRVQGTPSRSYEGSGIGLALVSELVKLHGGRVEVESAEGKGSIFKILIPHGKAHLPAENVKDGGTTKTQNLAASFIAEAGVWQQESPEQPPAKTPSNEPAKSEVAEGGIRPTVLVADDNADMRDYVTRLLSPYFNVTGVNDGRTALAAIEKGRPDLLLSDVMMPEMDGITLLAEIRSRPDLRSLPVILLSARAGEEARGDGLEAGADDYLTKPFSARELVTRVRTHLALARLRQDAATKVYHAEDRVQHLLALLPAGVYACDGEGRITFFNQRAVELWGRTPKLNDEVEKFCACYKVFLPDGSVVGPENTPMAVAIRTGQSFRNVEAEVERPDGKRFNASISIDPLRDEQGKIVGAINVFQDITEHKRTQEELVSRERLYRTIGESINYGIWVCDADGRNIYTSDSFLKLVGMTQEQCSDFGWGDVLHPDDAEGTVEAWKKCSKEGAFWEREHRFKGVDGQWHPVLARGMPVRDASGKIVRWAGLNLDIANFKRTEEALRHQSEILAVLNRVSSTLVAERNLEKIVQSVTDASREVSGAALGAFYYNVKNERGEFFTLHTLSGVPKADYAKYAQPNKKHIFDEEVDKQRLVRIADVTKEPDTGDEKPYSVIAQGGQPVRSYMAVPVISNSGEVLGGMFFSHPEPNVFTEGAEGILLSLAAQAAIAIDNAGLYNSVHRELAQVRRVEGELRLSETRWRDLAEAMPHLVWTCGPAGSYDYVSPQWCDYTGRTEEAQLGFGWAESIHPDDRSALEAAWNKAAHSREVLDMEMRIRRADGQYRWFKIRAVPVKDRVGNILKWYGSNTDIEDLKRTDLALREREAHLSAIFTQAGSGIIQTDMEGRISMVNEAYCEIVGRTLPQLLGLSIHDITHPEDRPQTQRLFDDMMRGGPSFIIEKRDVRADNSAVWVRNSVVGIRDNHGQVTAGLTITQDITESREAEDALRASEEQLRLVTDHAPVLLAQFDRDHRYKFVNQPYAQRYGLEPRDVIGKYVWEVTGANAYANSLDKIKMAFAGQRVEFEMEIPYDSLGMRWGHVIFVPELSPEGVIVGVVSVLTDITMRKQGEKELELARDRALAAVRAKDDFLARLSHELRTPLSPVLLLASEGAKNAAIPKLVRADFETIRKNVDLEARLIDDLLDLTRITRGKLKLDLHTVDVHAILKDAIATMQAEVANKNLRLNFKLDVPQHWVFGDAVRLQQVFWNLLNNAVKFTPSGGSITIETKMANEGGVIVIEVADTGIGMTSEELHRIFDAFSQGDHANEGASTRFGGLGLGLAITRMLVDLHHGHIQAASRGRGQGAAFSIELPLVSKNDAGEASPEIGAAHPVPLVPARESGGGRVTASLRILLVEDHEPTRIALSSLLGRRRHHVMAAGSLAEAREIFRPGKFDLIISDIGLPDGNGYELMSEWRNVPGLKGIALSGFGMEHDVSRSWEAGFSSHLTKPVKMETLDNAIAEATGEGDKREDRAFGK